MTPVEPGSGVYNALQEDLLEQFIEAGGRLTVHQQGRGLGYSTFAIVQCLQQALTSDRSVVYVHDDNWTPPEFRKVAFHFFGVSAVLQDMDKVIIGRKSVRLVKPKRYASQLRGLTINDVFGDVDGQTIDNNEEFFYALAGSQHRHNKDGMGMRLIVIR